MKKLFIIPKVRIPNMAGDYACASYDGKIDFSCNPYGNEGPIDTNTSGDTVEKVGIFVKIIELIFKIFG